jgi:hypothetical protein
MEKGLFNSLFVLIMLLLVTPGLLLSIDHQYIVNTNNQLDNISFNCDAAIADAIADETIDNSCVISNSSSYDSRIESYINLIISKTISNNSMVCTLVSESSSLSVKELTGTVVINCQSKDSTSSLNISKEIKFSKKIQAVYTSSCKVTIKDSYDSNNKQVEVTR